MGSNQCQINKEEINEIFKGIENRNNNLLKEFQKEMQEEKNKFDEKITNLVKFVQFRNKVDKIEAASNLIISPKKMNHIKKLTEKTEKDLYTRALKKVNGNEKDAISLLFDPSSDI